MAASVILIMNAARDTAKQPLIHASLRVLILILVERDIQMTASARLMLNVLLDCAHQVHVSQYVVSLRLLAPMMMTVSAQLIQSVLLDIVR